MRHAEVFGHVMVEQRHDDGVVGLATRAMGYVEIAGEQARFQLRGSFGIDDIGQLSRVGMLDNFGSSA